MIEPRKRKLLVLLIVATLLPLPFFVAWPDGTSPREMWLYLSAVAGYVGIVLLLWMYILGTKSVMGLYFRDLTPVLDIHKWLGKYGVLLIFAHPLAATMSYGESILTYSIVPQIGESFERSVTWGRFALYSLGVVWVSSALLRGRIAFRPWKYIHYIAYIALPLALFHVPSIGTSYRSLDAPRAYFLSVLLLLIIFSILRLRHLFLLGRVRYTVVRQSQILPGVGMVALKPEGRRISLRRGQYVYMQWSLLGEEHPFTILQSSSKTGELTIAYRLTGAWTKKLAALKDGTSMYIDGPYGTFLDDIDDDSSLPKVFIAAGIGITPFVDPILRDGRGSDWLFYANYRPETATFARQLSAKLGTRYVSILSQVDSPRADNDERGRLRPDIVSRYLSDPKDYQYYICGSEGFMETAERVLHTLGVSPKQIQKEAFGW